MSGCASFARAVGVTLLLALAPNGGHAAEDAQVTAGPPPSRLPDWSGVWISWSIAHNLLRSPAEEHDRPPLKDPQKLAAFLKNQAIFASGGDNASPQQQAFVNTGVLNAIRNCRAGNEGAPQRFNGHTGGGPTTTMEFLFTPGRVTILTDRNVVRRIYTRGQLLPKDGDFPTMMGFSQGHWEGQTLVVHTMNLDPNTPLVASGPAGPGFTIDERIYLKARDQLEIDAVVTAPALFSAPYHVPAQLFQREPFKPALLQDYLADCASFDRAVLPQGGQGFNLTPPADLPPPPGSH